MRMVKKRLLRPAMAAHWLRRPIHVTVVAAAFRAVTEVVVFIRNSPLLFSFQSPLHAPRQRGRISLKLIRPTVLHYSKTTNSFTSILSRYFSPAGVS